MRKWLFAGFDSFRIEFGDIADRLLGGGKSDFALSVCNMSAMGQWKYCQHRIADKFENFTAGFFNCIGEALKEIVQGFNHLVARRRFGKRC